MKVDDKNKILGILAAGVLVSGGSVGVYQVKAQNTTSPKVQASTTTQQQEILQTPSYKSSIKVNETKDTVKSEKDEEKSLVGLAKITSDQAKQAAEAKIGKTATSVALDNENGNVVYEVIVGKQEVKVDAGDGSILKIEQAENEKEGTAKEGVEKGEGIEKDGINHQFEGAEEHTD